MIRELLAQRLKNALGRLVAQGVLPDVEYGTPEITDPKSPKHGDYTCAIALSAAQKVALTPHALAEAIRADMADDPAFESIEVAGPGFLNFRLVSEAISSFLVEIVEQGPRLSRSATEQPLKINLEYVSVNPNGPITVGSGRGAAFGSALANVLKAAGHTVHREYYINDGVNSEQMRLFAKSVSHILKGEPVPERGYKGEYVFDVAERIRNQPRDAIEKRFERTRGKLDEAQERLAALKSRISQSSPLDAANLKVELSFEANQASQYAESFAVYSDALDWLAAHQGVEGDHAGWFGRFAGGLGESEIRSISQELMLEAQKADLEAFGVTFDTWFSEQSLHDCGKVRAAVDELIAKSAADEQPYRTILKMARGGVIEEVEREAQTDADELDVNDQPATPDGHKPLFGAAAQTSNFHSPAWSAPILETSSREIAGPSDGARSLWLRSTKFGDDMDRVLRRKDGRLTYIASDVAYHQDKFNRPSNADKLITVLGPDHHGYIGRLQAVVAALLERTGEERSTAGPLSEIESKIFESESERDACQAALEEAKRRLEVVIFQIVRFVKEGKPAPMRKRDGNIYSLRDLMSEIGKTAAPSADAEEQIRLGRDVSRFFYLMRSHETHMDFDIDLATKQTDDNPVFYVQYAHARICSVLRKALEAGLTADAGEHALLTHERERALIKKIADLPYECARCAQDYGVHRLTTFAGELARAFHGFYDNCRVIEPNDRNLSGARLALCEASRSALCCTFDLLGISAPERMEREPAANLAP